MFAAKVSREIKWVEDAGKRTSIVRMFVGEHKTLTFMFGSDDKNAASQGDPPSSQIKVS